MDAWTWRRAIPILDLWRWLSGCISSGRKAWSSPQARTGRALQNIVRNDCPFGLSWLISLVGQGGMDSPLAFLRINLLSLCYANNNIKRILLQIRRRFANRNPQAVVSIRAWGFFMATPSPLCYGIPGRQRIAQTLNTINLLDQAGLSQSLKCGGGLGGVRALRCFIP